MHLLMRVLKCAFADDRVLIYAFADEIFEVFICC